LFDSAEKWHGFVATLKFPTTHIVGVERITSPQQMTVVNPTTGKIVTNIAQGTEIEIDLAVAAARNAFDNGPWPRLAPRERKEHMLKFADTIESHRDELAALVTLEMGKPISDSWGIELNALLRTIRWFAELADKIYDEVPHVGEGALALITREPVGIVGVVTPWNFPLTLTGWKIAPALAVGCTLVIKPSEISSLSVLRLAELALESGIPAGVINVVTGLGTEAGKALGVHNDVDALAFTGSTATGRQFLHYSADSNLKHVWLELGGKSANIVFADAPDLEAAAQAAAWGIRFNSGQMCTAPTRLLLQRSIQHSFTNRVIEILQEIKVGDPFDPLTQMGPIASAKQLNTINSHIESARSRNLQEVLKSSTIESDGFWLSPVVFSGILPDDALAQEEIFGPVLAVIAFDTEEEAVHIANNSKYGLAAAIWTSDLSRAHKVARKIKAGTVWVNCYEEGDLTVPFGGMKQSGNGRDKSIHALDKYLEIKTTWVQL
jgi:gamma-glutamyl-gamma-aminobutyraldehyde dehydrogenase